MGKTKSNNDTDTTGKVKMKSLGDQFAASILRLFTFLVTLWFSLKKQQAVIICMLLLGTTLFLIVFFNENHENKSILSKIKPVGVSLNRYIGKMERRQFRILVIAHPWGGGTELFEDEILSNSNFDFIFFRMTKKRGKIKLNGMLSSKVTFYSSGWIKSTNRNIISLFETIEYDLIMIDFLQHIPELFNYLKKVNRPIIYVLHDHHPIIYDLENDMHLNCNHTMKILPSSTNNYTYSLPKKITGFEKWNAHQSEYAEVFRRCIAISTPSIRNKQIYKYFFPDIHVYSAPNRPILQRLGYDKQTGNIIVRRPNLVNNKLIVDVQQKLPLRKYGIISPFKLKYDNGIKLVVMGALSVGKGAHVIQDVSNMCSDSINPLRRPLIIYHIGSGANFRVGENHVVSLGAYNSTQHALALIASVDPHFLWFPALRHESYCYMLDIVLNSQYPIITSSTGSFPERLATRPFTYIAEGCLDGKQWVGYLKNLFDSLESGLNPPINVEQITQSAYDFESFSSFLDSISSFLSKSKTFLVTKTEPWMELLALNPKLVFQRGFADKIFALQELEESTNKYSLVNRYSLDVKFFQDKNGGLQPNMSKPPYTDRNPAALYNRLQWVSPASLLLVWDYLARNLPLYTTWLRQQQQQQAQPSRRVALLLDPRYSDETFAVAMNVMYQLGPGWDLHIRCSDGCDRLRTDFAGFQVTLTPFEDLPIPSAHKVSKWLMSSELWSSFSPDTEAVLVFQVDALLLRPLAASRWLLPSDSSDSGAFGRPRYPFIGAYAPGVGADMRTPRGVGMNGGLSLRSPAAMLKCLAEISPEKVNAYRHSHKLPVLPYDPANQIYFMEDVYYYHALEMLNFPLPSIQEQLEFSVQASFYKDTGGLHGYDKGWYLTTAQIALLLQQRPPSNLTMPLSL